MLILRQSLLLVLFSFFSAFFALAEESARSKMQRDFDAALNGGVIPNLADTMSWAGGTLIRTGQNELRYSGEGEGCTSLLLNSGTSLSDLASTCPRINAQWKSQYGVDLAANRGSQSTSTSTGISATSSGGAADNHSYINQSFDSALGMFIKATKSYKTGSLTKDQYLEVAMQLGQLAEYANKLATNDDPNKWLEVNASILPRMRADYSAYLSSSKAGDVKDFAGGKLYRKTEGALFVSNDGDAILLPESQNGAIDFNGIALMNSSLAKQWKEQYGFRPIGKTYYPSERGFSAEAYTKNIEVRNPVDVWYPQAYGVSIKKWIVENYNSLVPGGSKQWNGNTVIRAGSPNCLKILSADGASMTTFCISDDFDRNLPNDSFGTILATTYFGYNAP